MTPSKTELLNSFVSPKVPFGPSASKVAAEALQRDERYQRLCRRLAGAGLFGPAGWSYAWRVALFAGIAAFAFVGLASAPSLPLRIACHVCLGFAAVQGGFLSHEVSHGAVTRNRIVAQCIGQLFDTILVGLCFSYFQRSHELHHFHVNETDVDPDMHSSLWSVFERSARDKRGLGALMTRYQHFVMPFLVPLWGFQLKVDSMMYVTRNWRRAGVDIAALSLHAALFFGVLPFFVGASAALVDYGAWLAVASVYMFLVIPVNHVGKRSYPAIEPASFLEQQVASTRDLGGSWLLDFFLMGQNNHIEHHLFPQVPVSRLRRVRPIVRDLCLQEGLPYSEQGYGEAFAEVFAHLRRMGQLAALGAVDELDVAPDRSPSA